MPELKFTRPGPLKASAWRAGGASRCGAPGAAPNAPGSTMPNRKGVETAAGITGCARCAAPANRPEVKAIAGYACKLGCG